MRNALATATYRVSLAVAALRGQLDDLMDSAQTSKILLDEQAARLERLHKAMRNIQEQREYWYQLWRHMSLGYENAQKMMMSQIERLAEKAGEEIKEEWMKKIETGFHNTYVDPVGGHPAKAIANPEAKVVECPPTFVDPATV